MRILVIADYLPYPLIGGDRIRIYNLLRRVAARHEVSLAAFLEKPEDAAGVAHLQQVCARVETVSFKKSSRLAKLPGILGYALAGKPPELNLLHSPELVGKIRQLVSTGAFDLVQIEHSRMGLYWEALPVSKTFKTILMFHNFISQQDKRAYQIEPRWANKIRPLVNSLAMRKWEPRYAERFDSCTTVSTSDKELLLAANRRLQVDVIPNGVDIQKYQALPPNFAAPRLLFIGNMGYPPCVDAVTYFCREIFPAIRRQIQAAELWIVGRTPRPEVLQLQGDGVHVAGQVEDVIPYYQQSSVCIVPLRAGGGTRLKILEAMALGRPVVSTSIGCEGLDVVDGTHLLIADRPEEFAEKTVRLLTDPLLYLQLAAQARQLVVEHYDWDRIADKLMNVYSAQLARPSQLRLAVEG